MPIDDVELQWLFLSVFGPGPKANEGPEQKPGSYFEPPSPALYETATLAQLRSKDGCFLSALRNKAHAESNAQMLEIITKIEEILSNPDMALEPENPRAPRLMDFVYPVF